MNKTTVLIFICSFGLTSNLFSMKWSSDDTTSPIILHGNFAFLTSSENENTSDGEESFDKDSEENTSSNPMCAFYMSCPIAALTSSSEESDEILCSCCKIDVITILDEYCCENCIKNNPSFIEEEDNALEVSSASEIESSSEADEPQFRDDEPLFNHKMGNASLHATQQYYRAKKSALREQKRIFACPKKEQKVRALRKLEQQVLSGKSK